MEAHTPTHASASGAARGVSRAAIEARHVCLAAQPSTVFGSPDTLVQRGAAAFLAVTERLAEALVKAVAGKTSAAAIKSAIDGAAKRFGHQPLAGPVRRELLHGAMLGALDASAETERGRPVPVERFAAGDTRFAARPLAEAIKSFLQKEPVTRDVFDKMEADAQRRAFTVARAANAEMVKTIKRELIRQVATGADLRDFGKHAAKRFEAAGWTPANGSHVETVFRTNVVNAYSGGRVRQMSQPEVLEVRPYWQILGAGDGPPRQRRTHQAVHGVVLLASDPFWQKACPPFGYNCRCRLRSLSRAQGQAKAVSGDSIRGLPDPGFTSGMGELFPAGSPPPIDPNPKPANDPQPGPPAANDPPPQQRPANEGGSLPPPAPAPRAPAPEAPPAPAPAPERPKPPPRPRKPRVPKAPPPEPQPKPEPKPEPEAKPKPPRKKPTAPKPAAPERQPLPPPVAPRKTYSPDTKRSVLELVPPTGDNPLSGVLDKARVDYVDAGATPGQRQAVLRGLKRLRLEDQNPNSQFTKLSRVDILNKVGAKDTASGDALPKNVGGTYYAGSKVLKVSVNEDTTRAFFKKLKLHDTSPYLPGNTQNVAQTMEDVVEMTTVHEYAHHLHLSVFDFDADEEIEQAFLDGKHEHVSIYARQDHKEFWAESVTAYHYYPRSWMQARAPNTLALVERLLKAHKLLTSIGMAKTDPAEPEPAQPHPSVDQDLIDYCDEMAANPKPTRAQWQALMDKWRGRVNIESLLVRGAQRGWLK